MTGLGDRLRAFWDTVTASPAARGGGGMDAMSRGGPRVAGPPRSSNGASSFHLIWDLPRAPQASRLVEVSATLEIVEPPRVSALYFWAMQVDFVDARGRMWGGGHTGLQWNRRFPGGTAANWGGYASQELGGAVLPGSDPDLSAFPGDPNTMAFPWQPGRPYRLTVHRSSELAGAWQADIVDLGSGERTILRELMHPAAARARPGRPGPGPAYLSRPLVWSEVFADCDAPSVAVRWSDLSSVSEEGTAASPRFVVVNYQTAQDGGCANTTVRRDGNGLLQVTNARREIAQGSRLDLGAGRV